MLNFYVETTNSKMLKARLAKNYPEKRAFIAGCKGVGKSSLLRELYKDVCTRRDVYNVASEDVYYLHSGNSLKNEDYHDIYEKMQRKDSRGYVFIDNVQDMPADVCFYKLMLKEGTTENWHVVTASSRHGLFSLMKNKILSVDGFRNALYIISPEKKVGEEIFLKLMEGEEKKRTLDDCREDLDSVGYVPGCIVDYVANNCDYDTYKIQNSLFSRGVFAEDASHYSIYPGGDELYCKVLAIISSGQSFSLFRCHLDPVSLPWSFLKHERKGGDYIVSAVSPFVRDICTEYIYTDTDHIMKRFKAILQITGGNIGSLGGRLLEDIVFARLRVLTSFTYFYYEDTNIKSQNLDLANISIFRSYRKRDVAGIPANETASITLCPNAKHFDFFIVTKNGEVDTTHGIQVTMETRKRKCADSDFFKEGEANYIYLLTPELVNGDVLSSEITRNNAFQRAFTSSHLRVIDPLSVLTMEQFSYMSEIVEFF